ncbi:DNA primase [Caldimonas taiwanensis]|uniref:DNA primase n=1 Tax=Caldimonas taiwanensis TaxID=307483 RepID=UPI00078550EA|nr:DNA primase [Caldimonas taiwanensis]
MIPTGFKQDLLARLDIVEIVGRYVALKKAGIHFKGLCPFHAEKTPSFIVSPSRQTYHCFGCGAHGNAIDFLMEHSGLGFVDAVRELAQQAGLPVPEDDSTPEQRAQAQQQRQRQHTLTEVLERAATHYRKQLKTSPRAIDYLKRRGLTGEIAARFGLGYAPDGWRPLASAFPRYDDPLLEECGLVIVQGEGEDARRYDRFRDRIMFPIRNVRGEVIGFGARVIDQGEPKYLNSPETPVFVKGRELYGLYEARQALRQHGYALVVEGYMDVVALAQWGFPNAVATLGTACTADHVHKLLRFTDTLIFSFDGDAAGRRAATRALEAALPHATDTRTIKFLFLPPEHDPDSYIREHGREAFALCVTQAVPLSRQILDTARDGLDINSAEGRAHMLAAAKPLWNALPEGVLKQQILAELAQAGGLNPADLLALWQGRPPSAGRSSDGLARRSDWRRREQTPGPIGPRRAPPGPAEQAVRLLWLHSAWWDQLTGEDHELLHALPAPLGALCAWLERYLAEHGPQPWSVLDQALSGHPLHEAARRLTGAIHPDDGLDFSDLRALLDRLIVERLKAEESRLIEQAARDPTALQRYREVHERRRRLEAARTAAAGP